MIVCDFCLQFGPDGQCRLGLNIPKRMACRQFETGMEKFCSNRDDFVSPNQIIRMATFFGFKNTELKKIKLMAASAESSRAQLPAVPDSMQK